MNKKKNNDTDSSSESESENDDDMDEELENFENVRYRMKNEGIDYCFKHYSNFEEIKDEKFHELRNNFLTSIDGIQNYVDGKINELNDKINEI